jgi:hypothetical protein
MLGFAATTHLAIARSHVLDLGISVFWTGPLPFIEERAEAAMYGRLAWIGFAYAAICDHAMNPFANEVGDARVF